MLDIDGIPKLSGKTKDILRVTIIVVIFLAGISLLIHEHYDHINQKDIDHGLKENRRASMRLKIPFQGKAEFVIRDEEDIIIENCMCSMDNWFEGDSYFVTEEEYTSGELISIEEKTSKGYYMVIDNVVIPRIWSGNPTYFYYYLSENRFYVPDGETFSYSSGKGGQKVVLKVPPRSEPIPYMLGLEILDKYEVEGIRPVMTTDNTIVFEVHEGEVENVKAVKKDNRWTLP